MRLGFRRLPHLYWPILALTLVAPQDDFTVHALEVFEPFGFGRAQRYPVAALAADLDAAFHRDAVARERGAALVAGGAGRPRVARCAALVFSDMPRVLLVVGDDFADGGAGG